MVGRRTICRVSHTTEYAMSLMSNSYEKIKQGNQSLLRLIHIFCAFAVLDEYRMRYIDKDNIAIGEFSIDL